MKSYTDIEQSKKLAEILPIESVVAITIILAVLLLMSCGARVENSTSKRCYCNQDSIKAYIQQEVSKQLEEIYD